MLNKKKISEMSQAEIEEELRWNFRAQRAVRWGEATDNIQKLFKEENELRAALKLKLEAQ